MWNALIGRAGDSCRLPSPGRAGAENQILARNDDLVEMTRQLMEVGPEIGEIARRVGVFRETLRYRFQRYFVQRGLLVQANPYYAKLGLRRLLIVAKLSQSLEARASTVMPILGERCYLARVTETTFEGLSLMHVAVPSDLLRDCVRFYEGLRQAGIFTEMEVLGFGDGRSVPMRPEYYDFSNGSWEYDWRTDASKAPPVQGRAAPPEKYDSNDLRILNELDADADQTMLEVSRRLDMSHRTALYHYRKHVLDRGLIRGYRIQWQVTRRGERQSKRRPYLDVALLIRGTGGLKAAKDLARLGQLPFLCFEAFDPNYYAEFFVPSAAYMDLLKLIREVSVGIGAKPQVFILDQAKSLKFGIPCDLYDEERKRWRLDTPGAVARLESLKVNASSQGGDAAR